MISIAGEMIRYDRVRFLITVVNLMFIVAMVMYFIGFFFGTTNDSLSLINHTDANLWILEDGFNDISSASVVPRDLLGRVRAIAGVKKACAFSRLGGTLKISNTHPIFIMGIDPRCPLVLPWDVMNGNIKDLARNNTIVVDDYTLGNDPASMGDTVKLNDHEMHIVAVTHFNKSFVTPYAYVSLQTLADIGVNPDDRSFIVVQLDSDADQAQVIRQLTSFSSKISVFPTEEFKISSATALIVKGIGAGIGAMVLIGLMVGTLVTTITIYTATLERLREFAILKAIGAPNGTIIAIILEQVIAETVPSLVLGLVCALGLGYLIEKLAGMITLFPIPVILGLFVFWIILALAGALFSVRQAIEVDPLMVFRA